MKKRLIALPKWKYPTTNYYYSHYFLWSKSSSYDESDTSHKSFSPNLLLLVKGKKEIDEVDYFIANASPGLLLDASIKSYSSSLVLTRDSFLTVPFLF